MGSFRTNPKTIVPFFRETLSFRVPGWVNGGENGSGLEQVMSIFHRKRVCPLPDGGRCDASSGRTWARVVEMIQVETFFLFFHFNLRITFSQIAIFAKCLKIF